MKRRKREKAASRPQTRAEINVEKSKNPFGTPTPETPSKLGLILSYDSLVKIISGVFRI